MHTRRGTIAYSAAIIGLLLAAVGLASRYVPITNHIVLAIAAACPYLMSLAAISAVTLLVTRRWLTATAAVALPVAAIASQLTLFVGAAPRRIPRPSGS